MAINRRRGSRGLALGASTSPSSSKIYLGYLLLFMVLGQVNAFFRPVMMRAQQRNQFASRTADNVAGAGSSKDNRRIMTSMSDVGFGAGTKQKGGVKVGVKEKEAVKVSPKEREKFEVEWRVLLHNDEVHTFDYVSRKLSEVIPTLTRSKAWECTLAAHSHDFSTLAIVTKQTAEEYCVKLQKAGLTISVAPDSNFKKDGEGEGGAGGGGKSS